MKLDIYPLDIIILEETDEEEVREMFFTPSKWDDFKSSRKTKNAFPGK